MSGCQTEIPEGNRDPLVIPKGGPDNDEEIDREEDYNPFHGQAPKEELERGGGFLERLVRALDLNGGIKIEVADFFG